MFKKIREFFYSIEFIILSQFCQENQEIILTTALGIASLF